MKRIALIVADLLPALLAAGYEDELRDFHAEQYEQYIKLRSLGSEAPLFPKEEE